MAQFPYGFPGTYSRFLAGTDQLWPRCTNAEPGTYGHECGEPARYIGTTGEGFAATFCAACKLAGHEARKFTDWHALPPLPRRADGLPALTFEAARRA